MAKKQAVKPSRSRPASTSELNQPLLPSSGAVTASTASCSFSPAPDHTLFAHISNQVHQQRLRIYNASASAASTSQLVTDFLLASLGGAECLSSQWVRISTSNKSTKRRKHGAENGADATPASSSSSQLLLALGLSSGQVHLLSPALAQSVAILDASAASGSSTSSAANASVVSMSFSDDKATLFACSKSGWVSAFALADVKLGDQQAPLRPFSSFRPDTKSAVQLLASRRDLVLSAHHAISLTDASQSDNAVRASFTGHASPVTHLEWLSDNSFISAAEGDRIVSAWSFDDSKTGKSVTGHAFATAALDGPVRALSVCAASTQQPRTLITIVTQTGSVRIYGLPAESKSDASPSKKKSAALPSLELLAQSEPSASATEWIDSRIVADKLRLARLIRGAKVSIDETTIMRGKDAQLQKTLQMPVTGAKQNASSSGLLVADSNEAQLTGGAASTQRYADAPMRPQGMDDDGLATGLEDAGLVATPSSRGAELEPTLAQRLKELGFSDPSTAGQEAEEDDAQMPSKKQQSLTNEASLASSLSQALHSGDTSLLTSCLNHNDPILIRNTVRKISGPLSVKLLEECVSRLNGVGGNHVSKGSMGSQKARGLMEWVRATLLNHMGYLMSLPNLVSRLSGLHATLTTRLATHERLLALNGRLELVLSQIEARAAYMSQASNNQVRVQGVKFGKKTQGDKLAQAQSEDKQRRKGKKWVEETDDSDSDADDMATDADGVLVRGENDEEGDVQDIALGAESDEDDDEDSDDEDAGPLRRRRRVKNGRASDGNTSAESDSDADDDDDEDIEDIEDVDDDEDEEEDDDEEEDEDEDEDDEELPDESDLEGDGASDMEDDDDEEEYDVEDGGRGPNGMFDLEAEEGTDEDDSD
ncbi:hypothetical protein PaG_02656 [Moesziomyces aphidis]|uniref:Small-subunit processome Utp12 domain-containing protein n=1 Tax=Moesziomyces aphidis TaxID=84754 RepID=W3VMV1_MOEAP|nr:hypothetical protein PaG_02656 [Moesziomyces aphidis]